MFVLIFESHQLATMLRTIHSQRIDALVENFSHLEVFNKNCCLLLDQCENYSASGAVMDAARILSDMSFNNMMECVMSQTAEDNNQS